jgi:hypothetical protein
LLSALLPPETYSLRYAKVNRRKRLKMRDNGQCDEACSSTSRIGDGPMRFLMEAFYSIHWLTFAIKKMHKLGETAKKEHPFIDRKADCLSRITLRGNHFYLAC